MKIVCKIELSLSFCWKILIFLFLMIIWNEIEWISINWWKIVKGRRKKMINKLISHWIVFILMLNSFWDKHGSVLLIFLVDNDLFVELLRVSENKIQITKK